MEGNRTFKGEFVRGIGRSFAYKIWERYSNQEPLADIAQSLPKRQREGCKEFAALLENLRATKTAVAALGEILKTYKDYCYLSFDNADERILDLEELTKMAANYPATRQFLLDLSAFEDFKGETRVGSSEPDELLVLSTIHQAKGLEWEVVFIIGFSEYEFPHPKALNSENSLEEERRLFYVAATRTKSLLYITYPQTKYTFRNGAIITRPSQFLYELDNNTYEEIAVESGL